MLRIDGKVDPRHVVATTDSASYASAIVVNNDGSYEHITYMTDDMRTWDNECVIDATKEELEAYRKYRNDFQIGDTVKIVSGRKMKGEIKTIEHKFIYNIGALYNHGNMKYLRFTDGTAVQAKHCVIL